MSKPEIYRFKDIERVTDFAGQTIASVSVRGEQVGTPYRTSMRYFFPKDNHSGIIRLESPTYGQLGWQNIDPSFVRKSLLQLARTTSELTDGVVKIHPACGAVIGAMEGTIAPGIARREVLREDNMFTDIALPGTIEELERVNEKNLKAAVDAKTDLKWLKVFEDLHPGYNPDNLALQPMDLEMVRDTTTTLQDLGLFTGTSVEVRIANSKSN